MENKLEYAKKAIAYCDMIKDGISGLCSMMDITDETFRETDRITDYRNIVNKAKDWKSQYENYIKESREDKK